MRFQDETFSRVKLDSLLVEKGLAAKVIECFRESECFKSGEPFDKCLKSSDTYPHARFDSKEMQSGLLIR